jgi:hypothetical protein
VTHAANATDATPVRRGRGRPHGARNHPRYKLLRGVVYADRLRDTASWLIQVRRRIRRGGAAWSAALEREAVVLAVGAAQLVDQVRAMRPDAQGPQA